jgi:hypothetical protein
MEWVVSVCKLAYKSIYKVNKWWDNLAALRKSALRWKKYVVTGWMLLLICYCCWLRRGLVMVCPEDNINW